MREDTALRELLESAMLEWAVRFRDKNRTAQEVAILTDSYYRDLMYHKINVPTFATAFHHVNQNCKFFPSMREILDACLEAQAENARVVERDNKKYLDRGVDHERGMAQIHNINDMLEGKISKTEAYKRAESIARNKF